MKTILPSDNNLRYMGRIDFAAPDAPEFYFPGSLVQFRFTGNLLRIDLNNHSYDAGNSNGLTLGFSLDGQHGTLELSAIVIAGGAGITLGNGWLFPGTRGRTESFLLAARHSIRVFISIVPVIILAAFIEGFFTRYTDVGDLLRLLVILLSASFVIFYYVLLPIKRHRDELS